MTIVVPRRSIRREPIDLAIARIAEANHGLFAAHHLREFKATNTSEGTSSTSDVGGLAVRRGLPHRRRTPVLEGQYPRGVLGRWYPCCRIPPVSGRVVGATWRASRDRGDHLSPIAARQHDGLVVHESRALSERDVTNVDQIPITTVERTIFDLAAVCTRFTVDLAIDSSLRQKLTTVDELAAMLRRVGRRGLKGTRLLRALLADRDAGYAPTESEREQMLLRGPPRARPS